MQGKYNNIIVYVNSSNISSLRIKNLKLLLNSALAIFSAINLKVNRNKSFCIKFLNLNESNFNALFTYLVPPILRITSHITHLEFVSDEFLSFRVTFDKFNFLISKHSSFALMFF